MTVAAAIAARPRHAELYGAYGLVDDAVPVVGYGDCRARLARDRDLPAALDRARCTPSFAIGDWR